jgi:aryl-alcohol dehydrogenase-like predicted oxidoreductase
MNLRRLGSEGPEISVVGFGAWEAGGGSEWGQAPPDDRVIEAMRAALDSGMTWIDTAEVYGAGRSEELVGRAIAGRRDEVLVFSKVAPDEEGSGMRPEEIRTACESSLKRLGTDRIDLYQLHWPDESIPVEDSWGAMTELVDAGLVRWIGVSNYDRELLERCTAVRRVDSLQQEFSMLVSRDRELLRWCGEQGIGVLSYAPLAYGLLTGAISRETRFDPTDFRGGLDEDETWLALFAPGKLERSLAVVEAMRPIADRRGLAVAQLALAWNVHQPGVTAAIAGSRNPDHVRENAQAGSLSLGPEILEELEELVQTGEDPD